MRGHIRKAKNKKGEFIKDAWDLVVNLPKDPMQKRKQKWQRVYGSKKEAERLLAELVSDVESNGIVVNADVLFKDHLKNWLVTKEISVGWNTYNDYRNIIENHVIPMLGDFKVREIEPEHLAHYYSHKMAKGLSASTVRKHHRVLYNVFKELAIRNKIRYNPVALLNPPLVDDEFEPELLNKEKMVDVLIKAKEFCSKLYVVILLVLATGMRRGEIAGLRWKNVDLQSGVISIEKQYQRTRNGLDFTRLKNRKKRKRFKLPSFVVEELKKVKAKQERLKEILGDEYNDQDMVCCWPNGQPLKPDWLSRRWRVFREKYDLGNVRLHDTRHSHVTLLTELRVSDKEIQDRIGHLSKEMKDHYTHVTSAMDDYVADLIQNNLFSHVDEKEASLESKKTQDPV